MTLLAPLAAEEGWTNLQTPELIKWEKPGTTFAGVLTGYQHVSVNGKRVPEYVLSLGTQKFRFLGTYDIIQQLGPECRGCQVRIKYLGEDESVRGGPSNTAMKRFSIQIKGTPSNGHSDVPISDADIPF